MSGSLIDSSVLRPGTGIPGANISILSPLATTAAAVSSNLVTFTMVSNPITAGFAVGQTLLVAGFTGGDTYLNAGSISGNVIINGYTILSVTTSTVVVPLVHASGSASSNGTLLQMGDATHSGAGLATIYSDASLTTPITNPFTSDTLGNYEVGIAPGIYYVQIYGYGITTLFKQILASGAVDTTPGGGTTDVQINNGGVFGGDSGFQYTGGQVLIDPITPSLTQISPLTISASGNTSTAPLIELQGTGAGGDVGPFIFFTPVSGAGNTGSTRDTVALAGMDQTGGMGFTANQNGRDAGGVTLQGTLGDVPGALEVGVYGIINSSALTELFFTPDGGIDFYLDTESGPTLTIDSSANTVWLNETAANSGTNHNSPTLTLEGTYWTGSASAVDNWVIGNIVSAGSNPTTTLTFTHSGSSGNPAVSIPYPLATGVINSSGMTSAGAINILNANSLSTESANAATMVVGQSSELLTLSTGGATTDTSANLLPAGAIIDSVVVRVTTTISGGSSPTTWEAGDATTAARFISTGNALTSGTTAVGLNQMAGVVSTTAAGPTQASAAKVRITLDQTPGQGAVRITVFWRQFTAPTS